MAQNSVGPAVMAVLMTALLLAIGCAFKRSWVRLETDTLQQTLKKGDRVHVVTRDGAERQLEFVEFRLDTIVGETEKILISEVLSLHRIETQFDERKAIIHAGTLVALVLFIRYVESQDR